MQEPEDQTDEKLMQAYQLGDERAFAVLYGRHSAKIYGFLRGKLHDPASADDVFQATFMKLHQSKKHYDASFPFVPWLFTVCRSVLMDSFRKKHRIQETFDEGALERAAAPERENAPAIPSLAGLSAGQRKAIELRYDQDLPFEEIAKRLETSHSNVRQMISRAIRKLRGELK